MTGNVEVVSWSKDSIFVRWTFDDAVDGVQSGAGFKIRYQAVGSNVVQMSRLLDISARAYDITHLHENTNYDICVLRMRQPTATVGDSSTWSSLRWMTDASVCVKGTTSTDSLSVALGSTFGAFLALGLIVALVFVAKWQHARRAKKREQAAAQVTGNGAAGKAELNDEDNDDEEEAEEEDVLRLEIAELDTIPVDLLPATSAGTPPQSSTSSEAGSSGSALNDTLDHQHPLWSTRPHTDGHTDSGPRSPLDHPRDQHRHHHHDDDGDGGGDGDGRTAGVPLEASLREPSVPHKLEPVGVE